jgi:DNA-binding IclR family transcriptional regulator
MEVETAAGQPAQSRGASNAAADRSGVAAVDRAFAVLAAWDDDKPTLSLADLAARTGFYKSTILRLIASLERAGFVRRLADGRYQIGPAPLWFAGVYQRSFRLADIVLPVLRRLAADTGETASFYVRDGAGRVCLHRVEGEHAVRAVVREGDRLPLGRGAAGRVLLAFAGAAGADYDTVRAQGYAISAGEVTADVASIAAPVFGADGALGGAVNLSGPANRIAAAAQAPLIAATRAAAAELTRMLGGTAGAPSARPRPRRRRSDRP